MPEKLPAGRPEKALYFLPFFGPFFERKLPKKLPKNPRSTRNAGSTSKSCKLAPKRKKNRHFWRFSQADDQIRTGDLILTKDALYRLSYISAFLEREIYNTTRTSILQEHSTNINTGIFLTKFRGLKKPGGSESKGLMRGNCRQQYRHRRKLYQVSGGCMVIHPP